MASLAPPAMAPYSHVGAVGLGYLGATDPYTTAAAELESTEKLIAWADELSTQQRCWAAQRQELLSRCVARQQALWQAGAAQAATLGQAAALLHSSHQSRMGTLRCALAEAQRMLRRDERTASWHDRDLEDEAAAALRVERFRLSRERKALEGERARLAADARARERRLLALVQREAALLQESGERQRLEAARLEVEAERAWLASRVPDVHAAVQTDRSDAAAASSAGYSSDGFESDGAYTDDFEDSSESAEPLSESGPVSSSRTQTSLTSRSAGGNSQSGSSSQSHAQAGGQRGAGAGGSGSVSEDIATQSSSSVSEDISRSRRGGAKSSDSVSEGVAAQSSSSVSEDIAGSRSGGVKSSDSVSEDVAVAMGARRRGVGSSGSVPARRRGRKQRSSGSVSEDIASSVRSAAESVASISG